MTWLLLSRLVVAMTIDVDMTSAGSLVHQINQCQQRRLFLSSLHQVWRFR